VTEVALRCALAALLWPFAANAGPVENYREGARYCPHDRPVTAARITAEQAVERARALLPNGFCGPNAYVSGCDFDPELTFDSWRVYAQQYKLDGVGRHVHHGGDHAYVVLDVVGNCLAHIPGTALGARS
jgi:hypothetical protein